MANEPKDIKININVPEHLKGANYTNLFNVTVTSAKEVMIDFVFVHPQDKDTTGNMTGTVVSRIVMASDAGLALKLALESQLGKNKKE